MPNSGMFQRADGDDQLAASWMPAWPSKGLGYRTMSARPTHQSSFSRYFTANTSSEKRRPFSAPPELGVTAAAAAGKPLTPFTTRLLSMADDSEEKKDLSSALWKSASGQRRLKGPSRLSPFHTMQKPTCGYNFSENTEHRISKLGIGYADLNKWRFH